MVELTADSTVATSTDVATVERLVLRHFEDGAARAAQVIVGAPKPTAAVRMPVELLPSDQTWSSDWIVRQFQAYAFDLTASTVPVGTSLEILRARTLESLAATTGAADYFSGYCLSRGLDPEAVVALALAHLESTAAAYRVACRTSLGVPFGMVHEDLVQARLTDSVLRDADAFPHSRTVEMIGHILDVVGLSGRVDYSRESVIGVTVNVAHPDSRTAELFLAPARGIEAYRGALHALGHALFSIIAEDIVDDLGVNIAATEFVAFQAQHLALVAAPGDVADFLRFLHLYQSRLYAIRVLHEAARFRSRSPEHAVLQDWGLTHLGVTELRPSRYRPKLVAVDFILAFAEFYRTGEMRDGWSGLVDRSASVTNRALCNRFTVARYGPLDVAGHDVADNDRVMR